jgi:hypothetical protein
MSEIIEKKLEYSISQRKYKLSITIHDDDGYRFIYLDCNCDNGFPDEVVIEFDGTPTGNNVNHELEPKSFYNLPHPDHANGSTSLLKIQSRSGGDSTPSGDIDWEDAEIVK